MTARPLLAEFLGTFMLVLAIVGAALFAAPSAGLIAVALAAGIAVISMAYAVGHISGGHFNPAVTIGLVAAGKFDSAKAPGYVIAQVLGGVAAAAILAMTLGGAVAGKWNTFAGASNHYAPIGSFGFLSSFIYEVVITAMFLLVIIGATSRRAPAGFAPLAIGLALALFHIIAIPVTNASLNPARSTAAAVFAGSGALTQLWAFWVAPILGGIIGGVIGRYLQDE
ncbi:MAG: aquaporin [Hyphomicrobiaceae bacterium]